MAKVSELRIAGMTLGEITKIYVSSTLGKVSIALFVILISASIYAAVTLPPNFGSLWNNPLYWQIYPKDAPPAWVNYLSGNRYAPQVMFGREVSTQGSTVRFSFEVDNEYSVPWRDLYIVIKPMSGSSTFTAYLSIRRPDGYVITIGPLLISSMYTEVGTTQQVESQVIQFYLAKYGYMLTVPQGLSAVPYIFSTVSSGSLKPLKGIYVINLTLIANNPSKGIGNRLISLVLEGNVYGLMGTDAVGHDLWLGLLAGFPLSLEVGVVYALISTAIAIAVGLAAGFMGGVVDEVLTRLTDFVILIPAFVILVVLSVLLRLNIWQAMLYLAILSWGGAARIIRSITMQIRTAAYIELAKVGGASNLWILRNHALPQILPYALYLIVVGVPGAILTLAGLNFLNLAGANYPTWGNILYYAEQYGALESGMWWWVVPPGLLIVLVAVTFIVTALAIEPIVNPRLRR
jgi:peptide/nickel transport system permease protein